MRKHTNIITIFVLVIVAVGLQIHSSSLQNVNENIVLTKDELTYLQNDIGADSVLLNEYLETREPSEIQSIEYEREVLDEECDNRNAYFTELISGGEITSQISIETYFEARTIHSELESLKDATLLEHSDALENHYDSSEKVVLISNYQEKFLEASNELASFSDELSSHSIANSEKSSRNSLLTIGLSALIGLLTLSHSLPHRKRGLLNARELQTIGIIRRNTARNVHTTVKDIKRECGITQPTANTLLHNLQERNLIFSERNGREKRLFLR